ncbi:MAG: glycosyltransferase family 4 protein [Nitrospirota bacterium]
MSAVSGAVPSPLRVVYFRNARGISDVTGAESYLFALLRALDPAQVQGRLLAVIRPGQGNSPWVREARRRELPLELVEVDSKFGLSDLTALRRLVHDWKADLVHSLDHRADIIGLLAARLEGVAMVNAFFGWTNFLGGLSRGTLYTWADRRAQAYADAVITDSGYMARFAAGNGPGSSLAVVHNGVDVARFDPEAQHTDLRQRFFGRSDVFVFGMVGRVHPNKGQLEFLEFAREIAGRYSHTRFLIVGAAPPGFEAYHADVARRIDALGLAGRVVLTNVASVEIPSTLYSLDVLVAPSYVESFSYSLLEAMSMQRPVIATDVGGNREMMVDGESGLIVPTVEVPALVGAAERLLTDAELRARLGRAARARVLQRFTLAEMARRTTAIYREVLQARSSGLPHAEVRRRVQQLSA